MHDLCDNTQRSYSVLWDSTDLRAREEAESSRSNKWAFIPRWCKAMENYVYLDVYILLYVWVFACSRYHLDTWCPWKSEEGTDFLECSNRCLWAILQVLGIKPLILSKRSHPPLSHLSSPSSPFNIWGNFEHAWTPGLESGSRVDWNEKQGTERGPKQGTVHNLEAGSYSDVKDYTFVTG